MKAKFADRLDQRYLERREQVMSYEDLEKIRSDRAMKAAAKEAKKGDTVSKRRHNQ